MAQGDTAIDHVSTNQLYRIGVKRGDTIWIVTVPAPGTLHLVGRLVVGSVVGPEGAARRLERACVTTNEIFVLPEGGIVDQMQPFDVTEAAPELRFDSRFDRLPKDFLHKHLRTMRRMTTESADILWHLWHPVRRSARSKTG